MKKIMLLLAVVVIVISGCGGGGGGKGSSGKKYVYKWESQTALTADAASMARFSTKANAANDIGAAGYIFGSEAPPVTSMTLKTNQVSRVCHIAIYEQSTDGTLTEVTAAWASENGTFSETNAHDTVFSPSAIGKNVVTATVGETVVPIQVYTYPMVGLNINETVGIEIGFDFDTDTFSNDITQVDVWIDNTNGHLYTPYGSQTASQAPISVVTNAPSEGYGDEYIDTKNSEFLKVFFVKTSENKIAKLEYAITGSSIGGNSNTGYFFGFAFLLSNSQLAFSY